MHQIKGKYLSPEAKRAALAAFVHRSTGDHNGIPGYPLQFASDEEWLANTTFAVRNDGTLAKRRACVSDPTWPNNPELRR